MSQTLQQHSSPTASGGLLDAVEERIDELADRVLRCFRSEIPAYATMPEPDLRPGVRSNVERAIQALHRGWEPMAPELAAARSLGERRAQQGVPLDALLQAHRIGVREALVFIEDAARDRGDGAEPILELARRAWAWADAVMLTAAAGHRERELGLATQEQQQRAHTLRGLLLGSLDETGLRATAAYGISLTETYLPVAAAGPDGSGPAFERRLLELGSEFGATVLVSHLEAGLGAVVGGTHDHVRARDLLSAAADAGPPGLVVAVGPEGRPSELAEGYELAVRTLGAGRALGRTGLLELSDLPLEVALLGEPEIGRLLATRHLGALESEGAFGAELLTSLDAWFEHGMRTEETAAALVVHPNTLRHRLRRVAELTGLELDTTGARIELWWALTWRRLERG